MGEFFFRGGGGRLCVSRRALIQISVFFVFFSFHFVMEETKSKDGRPTIKLHLCAPRSNLKFLVILVVFFVPCLVKLVARLFCFFLFFSFFLLFFFLSMRCRRSLFETYDTSISVAQFRPMGGGDLPAIIN